MSETETELPTVVYGILMRFQIANGPLMIPSAFFFFCYLVQSSIFLKKKKNNHSNILHGVCF